MLRKGYAKMHSPAYRNLRVYSNLDYRKREK